MLRITAVAAALLALGCGSGDPGPGAADAGPFTTELACPTPGSFPFVLADQAWRFPDNEANAAIQPRIKHQPADILGNPAVGIAYTDLPGDAPLATDELLARGIMARTESNRGLFAEQIPGELVSIWEYAEPTGWQQLASAETATFQDAVPGGYELDLGSRLPADRDVAIRYVVLNAEQSCGAHYQLALATGRKVIVADIDGTLTASDDEILTQIADPTHDPVAKTAAGDVMRAWAAKGYHIIYLTARPHLLRTESRTWLEQHDYPPGPMITATDFVFDESARAFKAAWVSRILEDLGWDVVAAYGNATSDIAAYADAAIPKSVTFIIGEHAGADGTVAIENDDYTAHLQDYVTQQPDAD